MKISIYIWGMEPEYEKLISELREIYKKEPVESGTAKCIDKLKGRHEALEKLIREYVEQQPTHSIQHPRLT